MEGILLVLVPYNNNSIMFFISGKRPYTIYKCVKYIL